MRIDFKRERDIVIVGGGPAGASAAYYLAKRGFDVTVLESKQMPRAKPCGDGIGPRGVLALENMGLGGWLKSSGAYRVERLRIVAPSGKSITSIAEPSLFPVIYGYIINRDVFDLKLIDYARGAGAEIIENFSADNLIRNAHVVAGVTGFFNDQPQEVRAKLIIIADGSKGRLSRLFGPDLSRAQAVGLRAYATNISGIDDCANIYFTRRSPKGYGWIFPNGPTSANIGVGLLGLDNGSRGAAIRNAFSYFTSEQDLSPASLRESVIDSRPAGSVMRMNFGLRPLRHSGLAFIGDAAGLVSPINGEGISHAIESGQILSEHLPDRLSGRDAIDRGLADYEKAMRKRFLSDFRWGRMFNRAFGNPEWLDRVVAKAQKDEYLRAILGGVLTNTVHPRELVRLKVLAKILF